MNWGEFAKPYKKAQDKRDFYLKDAGEVIRKKANLTKKEAADPLGIRKKLGLIDPSKAVGQKGTWEKGKNSGNLSQFFAQYAKKCGSQYPEYDALLILETIQRFSPDLNLDEPALATKFEIDQGFVSITREGKKIMTRIPCLLEVILREKLTKGIQSTSQATQKALDEVKKQFDGNERFEEVVKRKISKYLEASTKMSFTVSYLKKNKAEYIKEWTGAIYTAMATANIPFTDTNIAICLTQIEREGEYMENPRIPDSEALYRRYKEKFLRKLDALPDPISRFKGQIMSLVDIYEPRYKSRFLKCRSEREVEKLVVDLFREIEGDPILSGLFKTPLVGQDIKEYWESETKEWRNPVKTVGAMQLDIGTARRILHEKYGKEFKTDEELRDFLYKKEGNLLVGFTLLKQGIGVYLTSRKGKVENVFADYNAGPFASRNATFQRVLNTLDNVEGDLVEDGDLLAYTDEDLPLEKPSKTELKIRQLRDRASLSLTNEQIRYDLLSEKKNRFEITLTYRTILHEYKRIYGSTPSYLIPSSSTSNSKEKFGQEVNTSDYVMGSMSAYTRIYGGLPKTS